MFHGPRSKRRAVSLLMAFLLTGLAACGGGEPEEEPAEEETPKAAEQEVRPGQPKAEFAQYCEKALAIETYPEPEIDFEALTPAQQTEETKKFAGQLVPLAEEVRGLAPAEIRNDINVLADAVKRVQETGDFEAAFGAPEVDQASDRAHAFDLENCGWGQVDATAVNYEFQGIPEEVAAGPTSFELNNEGTEPHELIVFRIKDDVDESVEEILELPEEEAMEKAEFVSAAFADPGNQEYGIARLEEGRYAAVCFIPVGSKPEGQAGASPTPTSTAGTTTTTTTAATSPSPGGTASPGGEEGEEGPPHFTRGMFAEFTVS